jgi:hypothetical protein
MTIELNHTIVGATDKHASAHFLADILGRAVRGSAKSFLVMAVEMATRR